MYEYMAYNQETLGLNVSWIQLIRSQMLTCSLLTIQFGSN